MNSFSNKQPKVFYLASITSLAERFAFYILSVLLVLYLIKNFHFSDFDAFILFTTFSALVFFLPAFCGYLADNVIGIRRSIILGLIAEGLGFVLLSLPYDFLIYPGLSLIAIGVGFFKTAPTNLMGRGYKKDDPRIDSGFTLFYMMMNLGSFVALFSAEIIQIYYGWHVAFIIGAIGILISLIIYFALRKSASNDDVPVGYKKLSFLSWCLLSLGLIIGIVFGTFLLYKTNVATIVFYFIAALLIFYFGYEIVVCNKNEKLRILACLALIIIGFIFFILYFQVFTSMELFISRSVEHEVFGINIPTTTFLALNPFWVIILSPVLAWVYKKLHQRKIDLAVTTKFPIGLFIMTLCYFILKFSTFFYDQNFQVSGAWIVLGLFFYSLGELLVSALGVAMVTRIAPKKMYGVMMGSWFLIAVGFGAKVSGQFANFSSVPKNLTDPHLILTIYGDAFFTFGIVGLIITIFAFIAAPFIKKIAQID